VLLGDRPQALLHNAVATRIKAIFPYCRPTELIIA